MSISLNTSNVTALAVGSQSVSKVYLGNAEVWSAGGPPPPLEGVSLLLHFDGDFSNSGTASLSPFPATYAYGDAPVISADVTKYGSGSGQFFDHGYVDAGDPRLLAFDTGDFTVEAWINPTTAGNYPAIFGPSGGDGNCFFAVLAPGYLWVGHYGAGWVLGDVPISLPSGEWHHIAISRKAGTLRLFRDGVMLASGADGAPYPLPSVSAVCGAPGGGNSLIGYMDEVRVTNGFAIYETDFVVPAGPLDATAAPMPPAPAGTLLFSGCDGGDLVGTYADGYGGRYTETISAGACS